MLSAELESDTANDERRLLEEQLAETQTNLAAARRTIEYEIMVSDQLRRERDELARQVARLEEAMK